MENDICKEIICSNEKLILTPLKAAYWPAKKTLILADLHLGKSAYFRNKGIAIPSTVMMDDLLRISKLIEAFETIEIIVVGDMFHHNYNTDISLFKDWRQQNQNINLKLVPGNHDKLLDIDYEQLQISVTAENYSVGALCFEHDPKTLLNDFIISGHLHPGYTMYGKARQAMRFPCFIHSEKQLILPAFSTFTGLYTGYEKTGEENYFVVTGQSIFCF